MSASPEEIKPKRDLFHTPWFTPVVTIGVLMVFIALYYGIGFILTRQVNNHYTEHDCNSLLDTSASIEKFYPVKIASFTDPARVQAIECRAYLKADSLHNEQDWKAAFDAYEEYRSTYPRGIFDKEARDLAADSLLEVAAEQRGKEQFADAVENLIVLIARFEGTPSVPKAKAVLPEVYMEWGAECHAKAEFSEAEDVYNALSKWATQKEKQDYVAKARLELAQTYFDWGKDLHIKKDFTNASDKFNMAAKTDPTPKAKGSATEQVNVYLPGFHLAWGEYLLSQSKFSDAIQHFKKSVELSSTSEKKNAQNALSDAYLVWAEGYRKMEDYNQALSKIDDAYKAAGTSTYQKKAEAAREETLIRFSNSGGAQAVEVMNDAKSSICEDGKPLEDPPIIGISEIDQMVISGVELPMPSSIAAGSPGELQYVVCGDIKDVTVQKCPYSTSGYGTASYWIERIRYDWTLKVFDAQTGKLFKQKTFTGPAPESCPMYHSFSIFETTHYHKGDRPSATTMTDWLASLLK